MSDMISVGQNIQYQIAGNTLIITIRDITADYGKSTSGKTTTVASTNGFIRPEEAPGLMFSVNVNRKA